jgi:hypothetical protein
MFGQEFDISNLAVRTTPDIPSRAPKAGIYKLLGMTQTRESIQEAPSCSAQRHDCVVNTFFWHKRVLVLCYRII